MNKKFLSAILFGALMVTSTGTFVSCKDYDDDIENLQTQINANSSAIAELKALVGDGNYVTGISVNGQNLVVNTKNGSTNVTLPKCEDKVGSFCTISEEGELFIDGKATGIKVAESTEATEFKPCVEIIDGEWAVLQEDGSYLSTGVAVSSVAVTGDEKEGFILTITDAEGVETVIELPTAASSITSMTVKDADIKLDWFTFAPTDANKKAWKEATGREVTSDRYIVSSATALEMRINPVTVDATEIDFNLVSAKNETMPLVELVAAEYKDYVTSRAAYGNGLYTLTVKPFSLESYTKDSYKAFEKYLGTAKGYFAVAANSAVRAEYNVTAVWGVEKTANFGAIKVGGKVATGNKATVKAGVEQAVSVETPSHLYDLFITAKSEDINIFGIEISADKKSFTITKTPDQVTAADFPLTVYTMDNNGVVKATVVTITLSEAIDATAEYATRTLAIVSDATKNFFKADMATMKTGLGSNLDLWKRKVTSATVAYYKEATCENAVAVATGASSIGITMSFVNADDAAAGITAATDMKFAVTNADASKNFAVNTVYYAKVSFSNGTEVLNSIVVPFQFTVPALSTYFEVEPAVFKGDVAYAYMTKDDNEAGFADYKLSRAFKKFPANVAIALDDETAIVGESTSKDLAFLPTAFTATSEIRLKKTYADGNVDGTELGYAQELIITATEATYEGWKRAEADQTYTFKIKVMSPIFEGTVTSIKSSVEVPVTSVDGYKMGNNDIEGKTYGAVAYKVFQDVTSGWSRPEIASVSGKTSNTRVVMIKDASGNKLEEAEAIGSTGSGESFKEGYLQIVPQNIENTTEVIVNLTVTDCWGYKKVSPITVKVVK